MWLDKDGHGQPVNLSTNSDKSCLRIRSRSRDENDNENDGFKSNQRDIRLKIRHIARVGSDRERALEQDVVEGSTKSTSYFVIKMKQSVGEWVKFKFVAESLAERDAVVLAIRSLMDHHQPRYHLDDHSRRGASMHDRCRAEDRTECRMDNNETSRSKELRQNHPSSPEFDTTISSSRTQTNERFARESLEAERRMTSQSAGRNSIPLLCGKPSATRKEDYQNKSDHHRKFVLDDENIISDDIQDEILFDSLECSRMNCQARALAAVGKGDFMNFAANQISGPWCTDDVCTASLTDFANSMKGIFDKREGFKYGMNATGQKQREIAEKYISDFLGDKTTMSELLTVKELWVIAETKRAMGKEIQLRRIQNRARHADGKALRLNSLRTQMTFYGSNMPKKMAFLQTTNSLDDVNRCGKWSRRVQSVGLRMAGQLDASSFLDNDISENDVLCYDSDPEGARERTMKRGPRRAIAERENTLDDSARIRREALDIVGSSRFGLDRKWRRQGDEVVLDIIEVRINNLMMQH
jgi:hypothetical protein